MWHPMSTRPNDGQLVVYYFEPFKSIHVGTYHEHSETNEFDCISGKSGFTTVNPEVPWWMPLPPIPGEQRE
jgi:hypothetical protein